MKAVKTWLTPGLILTFPLISACGANPPGVVVTLDPTVALTNFTGMGEWNTAGNFEGWSVTGASGAAVSGGVLSATASGSNPQLTLAGVAGGPDLDLAFNDYMDLRLQVPAGFGGPLQVYYGATNRYVGTSNSTAGFSATSRVVTITNVPTDGAFHVYRIFWGPDVYWRGNLSDVRVDPLGTTATVGQAFALDYVRVGDLTGDIYYPSYVAGSIPGPGTNDPNGFPVLDMSSKHFRFCWDVSVASNSYWTASMPHGTLRNLEECWKSHVWRMGYPEPSRPQSAAMPYTGPKYKVNFTTWNGGYWTGVDGNGIPWLNITPDGDRVEPPTWVPPHEFTHACQDDSNTNGYPRVDGQFWENNANYGREQWLYAYPWWTNNSNLDPYYADTSHFWLGHGRNYYLCWPFWLYLDENPDNLPGLGSSYGSFFSVSLWKYARPGEYLWDTLARLAPNAPVQDIMGYMARRDVMWDYSHRVALTNAANTGDAEQHQRWTYAELRQRPDDPTWWQTPLEFAPQQAGYKIHKLIPQGTGAGRVVSVNFHGLPDSARGADWRACLVVVSDTGAVRYSSLWNAGLNSVTLAANENTVYLSVAGTPTTFLAESVDETVQPYQTAPSKARFPYEIQVAGATPYETPAGSTTGLVQVPNGGGWRASSATVDSTVYVGPNARVLGSSKVRNYARILDYAIVEGSAVVSNYAVISGHALVRDTAVVRDHAKVRDYAMVTGSSVVKGYARILQHGQVTGGSSVADWATVKGSANTWYDSSVTTNAQAWNDAVLDGDFATAQSCSNGFQFGFIEYNPGPLQWITNRTAPRRLFASYEFASPNDSLAKDSPGVTDGYLQGNPAWLATDGTFPGFLVFNGAGQYVILDRSLSDLPEITVTAWVRWAGGAGNQPVWYFGTAATNCMYLTPDDGTGHARFCITSGGVTQTLTAPGALPAGVWAHLALSLSNALTGRLYLNGTNVATGSITLQPDQLNAPDVNTALQQNYLARGAGNTLPFFNGCLAKVRVYTGPLTDMEIAALAVPPSSPPPTFVRHTPTNGLFFSAVTESLPASGQAAGSWPSYLPGGASFAPIGSPTVAAFNSVKWEQNNRITSNDGFLVANYSASPSIPCHGVSIVAAVKPVYCSPGGENRGEIVDIMYDRLAMAVSHPDGRVMVAENGNWGMYGTAIPNNTPAVLSLVVQPNGSFVCYLNGVSALTGGASGDFSTAMTPTSSDGFKRYVNIGRNNPDGWSAYNGYIGDLFVYTNALTTTDRQTLESDLTRKFITPNTPPTISTIGNLVVTIPVNTSTGPLAFTVTDAETPAGSLAVSGSSSNPALVPSGNIVFGGSGSNRTVTVTPAAGQLGSAIITVTVNDGAMAVASQFMLVVTSPSSYTITATAGTGGSISPSGSVVVVTNANQSFSITASNGFAIVSLSVDGVGQGATNAYTFQNVTTNHTIFAAFKAVTLSALTISANGSRGLDITWSESLGTNLLSSTALGAGASWNAVEVPAPVGGFYKATVTPTNATRFYRLAP